LELMSQIISFFTTKMISKFLLKKRLFFEVDGENPIKRVKTTSAGHEGVDNRKKFIQNFVKHPL
jgi:hypothetical protein